MPACRWLATVVVLGAGAVIVPITAPAGASSAPCVAHGSLPGHVALGSNAVVVRSALRGSSTCHHQRTDNGATATLRRPGAPDEQLRWRHFGSVQKVKLYANIDAPGHYRLAGGNVQVYGHDYRQVDYRWRKTSMTVKRAARFVHTRESNGTIGGRAERYLKFGWRGYGRVCVALERGGRHHWRTVTTRRTDRHGRVRFTVSPGARYRLSFAKSTRVWGARSGSVRG
ncbi:MAG TPA: hypothetical protein VGH30_05425 [Jatrophihabitantaceae bacterium]|jgi:hypothetical protein